MVTKKSSIAVQAAKKYTQLCTPYAEIIGRNICRATAPTIHCSVIMAEPMIVLTFVGQISFVITAGTLKRKIADAEIP